MWVSSYMETHRKGWLYVSSSRGYHIKDMPSCTSVSISLSVLCIFTVLFIYILLYISICVSSSVDFDLRTTMVIWTLWLVPEQSHLSKHLVGTCWIHCIPSVSRAFSGIIGHPDLGLWLASSQWLMLNATLASIMHRGDELCHLVLPLGILILLAGINGVWCYGVCDREFPAVRDLCAGLIGQSKAVSIDGSSAQWWALLMALKGIISFLSPFWENVIPSTDFLRRFSYALGN